MFIYCGSISVFYGVTMIEIFITKYYHNAWLMRYVTLYLSKSEMWGDWVSYYFHSYQSLPYPRNARYHIEHIKAWTKWPLFCKRYFPKHFHNRRCSYIVWNFADISQVSIALYSGVKHEFFVIVLVVSRVYQCILIMPHKYILCDFPVQWWVNLCFKKFVHIYYFMGSFQRINWYHLLSYSVA